MSKKKLKQLGLSFQDRLLKRYFVRWHMSVILAATVGSGLLIDRVFLHSGFGDMGWRYALSVLGAYGFFFVLVRMWVWYAAGVAVSMSLPDVWDIDDGIADDDDAMFSGFAGGDSGGGGASDAFDVPALSPSGSGGGLNLDVDLDDGFWILLVLALLAAIVCGAGVYLIWMAPQILPDVALECAVAAGLVKGLKQPEAGWARRLLWKTGIPLIVVLAAAYFAGGYIQSTCPGATHARAALHCVATR